MDSPVKTDVFWGGCLCVLGILYLYFRGAILGLPFEDAAILMRYVDHLAQGEGMVWNLGEAPVDGATDFLFVVIAAALQAIGLKTEWAVQGLAIFGFLGTILLVYLSWRKENISRQFAFAGALIVMLGPAYAYIEAYFATPFFAFLGSLLAYFGLALLRNPHKAKTSIYFGISSLLLGLCRPEGVLLSFFMLLSLLVYLGWKESVLLRKFYLVFLVGVGSFYLIWHYLYFGHLFPNPFYKKGGGLLYPSSLFQASLNSFRLVWPLFLPLLFQKYLRFPLKTWLYLLLPVLGFSFIWILLSNEMNYLMRFQYVLFPITLIHLGLLWRVRRPENSFKLSKVIAYVSFAGMYIYYSVAFIGVGVRADGRYEVAQILADYSEKNYRLACTEAGLLPFYSRWRSLDTWGLNDHKIAIEGVISLDYLKEFNPDLIMYDAFEEEEESLRGSIWDAYPDMIDSLSLFITQEEYSLIAKFPASSGKHAHYYYIRKDLSDADSIRSQIRNCTYYWFEDGLISNPIFP